MLKKINSFLTGFIACAVLTASLGIVFAENIEVEFNKVKLTVNGKVIEGSNILYDGITYVPIRTVAESLGKFVGWNEETNTASINDTQQVDNTKTGNIKGTITWQYNNYVGTKPDVGASVILIAKDHSKDNPDNIDDIFNLTNSKLENGKHGIYYTKADGYGNYDIQNVSSKEYFIIIKSAKTYRYDNENAPAVKLLKDIINDSGLYNLEIYLRNNKHIIKSITIEPDKTITESHDFGNTEI